MTTEVLGSLSFLETPTVAGAPVLLNAGGVPSFQSGTFAARPAAGAVGTLYVDTTNNLLYRDNGTTWDTISATTVYTGAANEITVSGSLIDIADNPIIPGTARMRLPVGTTAQRPGTPVSGDARFNSTTNFTEEYNGTYWSPMGRVLQIVSGTIASSTGTTQIPWDNTTPLITEGHQIWTQSFTPISTTSRIVVEYTLSVATSVAARTATSSIFFGATVIGAVGSYMATTNVPYSLAVRVVYTAGSTATVTVQGRCGSSGTGTLSVNQANGNNLAGAAVTQYTITEIA
jgi:hypothetical protein